MANIVADFNDTSDFLYNAYSEAQKGKQIVKKIRRMKSQSPPRPGKTSPGRHRSPLRNRVGASGAQGSSMLANVTGDQTESNQASDRQPVMIKTTSDESSAAGAATGVVTTASSTTNLDGNSNLDVTRPRKDSVL